MRKNSAFVACMGGSNLKQTLKEKGLNLFCLPPTTVVKFVMDPNIQGKHLALPREKKAHRKHKIYFSLSFKAPIRT
jgi:hypothetical protein